MPRLPLATGGPVARAVIPAKAGIQPNARASNGQFWMPTFAEPAPASLRHNTGAATALHIAQHQLRIANGPNRSRFVPIA